MGECMNEQLVIEALRSSSSVDMEHLVMQLPQLSWNCVFHTIDSLSRTGQVILRRRGTSYELSLRSRAASVPTSA